MSKSFEVKFREQAYNFDKSKRDTPMIREYWSKFTKSEPNYFLLFLMCKKVETYSYRVH